MVSAADDICLGLDVFSEVLLSALVKVSTEGSEGGPLSLDSKIPCRTATHRRRSSPECVDTILC